MKSPVTLLASGSYGFRSNLSFHSWELWARFRHLLGIHTWIDVEDWTREDEIDIVEIVAQECWLCPTRR